MRILKIDYKTKELKVVPEINDDLWHLERIIEPHDLVSGSTNRKIKPKEEGSKQIRVNLFLTIDVEKIDFRRETGNLRVTGNILEGKPAELIETGASHSIEIELGKELSIKKKELKKFQIERLEKAKKASTQGKVLLVVLDDEQADFALLKEFELERKGMLKSGKTGKMYETEPVRGNYFSDIIKRIEEAKPEKVVVAGPGFAKEKLHKLIDEKKPKGIQFFYGATNSTGITGLQELIKAKGFEKIIQEMQLVKETKIVESIFAELGKGSGLVEYGFEQVKNAVEVGAVKELLVVDTLMLDKRSEVEPLMEKTEQMKGEVHLIDAENDAGKKLESMGGIVAFLRYRLN